VLDEVRIASRTPVEGQ